MEENSNQEQVDSATGKNSASESEDEKALPSGEESELNASSIADYTFKEDDSERIVLSFHDTYLTSQAAAEGTKEKDIEEEPKKEMSKSQKRKSLKMELKEDIVAIEGGEVKYILGGSRKRDSELVVILHGIDFISVHFKELMKHLGGMKSTTVLAFDFLGRGESSFVEEKHDANFFVDQIPKVLKALNLEREAISIIGYDLGGAVGVLFTLKYPTQCNALVLISPLGLSQKKALSSVMKIPGLNSMIGSVRRKKEVDGHKKAFKNPEGELYEWSLEKWQLQNTRKGYMSSQLNTLNNFPLQKLKKEFTQLGELKKRILLLWGDEDVMSASREAFAALLPTAEVLIIPEASRACFVEKHYQVFTVIKSFLRSKTLTVSIPLKERFQFCLLLSAACDALGYKNGSWEYENNGKYIHDALRKLGGVTKQVLEPKSWRVSDETVMHIATCTALLAEWKTLSDLYANLASAYADCFKNMSGRGPGVQCGKALPFLEKGEWDKIPLNSSGEGCGGAVRSMAIGLWFHSPKQLDELLRVAMVSARMTHNHPVGVLGAVCAALFTSYALQRIPPQEWGMRMVESVLPLCKEIVQEEDSLWEQYQPHWDQFETAWREYLKERGLLEGNTPVFPEDFNVFKREKFYQSLSVSGIGGSSGHDCVIIAYDAFLGAGDSWEELVLRGALHGGNSDSTGAIAGAWYGAFYGGKGVAEPNWQSLEFRGQLEELGEALMNRSEVSEERLKTKKKKGDKWRKSSEQPKENDTEE